MRDRPSLDTLVRHAALTRHRHGNASLAHAPKFIDTDGCYTVSPEPGILLKPGLRVNDEVLIGPAVFRITAVNVGKSRMSLQLIGCEREETETA